MPGADRLGREGRARSERALAEYNCTAAERRVLRDLLADGWTVYKRGWPDFLAVRAGEVRLVEVKAHRYDRPSEAQLALFRVLEEILGLRVEIVLPSGEPAPRA